MKMDYNFDRLFSTNEKVQLLDWESRKQRLSDLIEESYFLLDLAIQKYTVDENKGLSNKCLLFSGGNDSTALLYLFKDKIDYVLHINTGIGIEQTREFVRNTCKELNLSLKEYKSKPEDSYENLIMQRGFPGPGQHYLMYQRLKERALRLSLKDLNPRNRKNRIVYIAGRRRDESKRRMNIPFMERQKAVIWVSPLYNWTKADIETFRKLNPDIPRNEVADLIHMSGECLCGAFAHPGEKEEIRFFYPEVVEYIEQLENKVKELNLFPEQKCKWGWGAYTPKKQSKKIGVLCSSCESAENEDATVCDAEIAP